MRTAAILILLLAVAGCAIKPPPMPATQPLADPRDWTLADGQEFFAVPISVDSRWVNLRTVEEDTQVISIPLDSLSEQDREWVESGGRE